MKLARTILAFSLAISPAVLLAQTSTTAGTTPTNASINQRKVNQQDRIAKGVQSGQLTAGETQHLEKQEAAINKEERAMRAQDNGHLTTADKKLINQQQNQESKRIYKDKHNASVR